MTTVVKSLNKSLQTLLEQDPSVVLLGEDLVDPYGGTFKVTKGLSILFPHRVLSTPISEGTITGMAAGMAMRGLRPIVEIMFGDFLTLCADQLVNHIAKYRWMYNDQVTVPLVVRTPMGGRRGYGPTHSQTTEKLFCGVPGLQIVAVNRLTDPGQLLEQAVKVDEPVLFIENKTLYPQPLHEISNGRLQDSWVRWVGEEFPTAIISWTAFEDAAVTLVAYGGISEIVLQAARELMLEDELACEVVVPSHIKPFDLDPLLASAKRSGHLAVFEEGTEGWGWGREVAYQALRALPELAGRTIACGSRDLPIGNSKALEDRTLLQVEDVKRITRELMQGGRS
ncbi:MAG: transketolase C-terminal domain-containing protein [Candidatus Omnitrophota bacterium]|nr:transketolase C-terminal domain-containing protein [Candidatus Omnitrophota bacterium]